MAYLLLLYILSAVNLYVSGFEEVAKNFNTEETRTTDAFVTAPHLEHTENSRSFYDYEAQAIAYKDLVHSVCYIEKIKLNYMVNWKNAGKKSAETNGQILQSEIPLSKNQVWVLAGSRIYEFCRGYPTYFLQYLSNGEIETDVKANNIYDLSTHRTKHKRSNNDNYRPRVGGQTQSQYLNFGTSNEPGKAEAESTFGSSRAAVSGTSGMGQAQSQSIPVGCDGCYSSEYDHRLGKTPGTYEKIRWPTNGHGRPGLEKPIDTKRPGGPAIDGYKPETPDAERPGQGRPTGPEKYTPGTSDRPGAERPGGPDGPGGPISPPRGPIGPERPGGGTTGLGRPTDGRPTGPEGETTGDRRPTGGTTESTDDRRYYEKPDAEGPAGTPSGPTGDRRPEYYERPGAEGPAGRPTDDSRPEFYERPGVDRPAGRPTDDRRPEYHERPGAEIPTGRPTDDRRPEYYERPGADRPAGAPTGPTGDRRPEYYERPGVDRPAGRPTDDRRPEYYERPSVEIPAGTPTEPTGDRRPEYYERPRAERPAGRPTDDSRPEYYERPGAGRPAGTTAGTGPTGDRRPEYYERPGSERPAGRPTDDRRPEHYERPGEERPARIPAGSDDRRPGYYERPGVERPAGRPTDDRRPEYYERPGAESPAGRPTDDRRPEYYERPGAEGPAGRPTDDRRPEYYERPGGETPAGRPTGSGGETYERPGIGRPTGPETPDISGPSAPWRRPPLGPEGHGVPDYTRPGGSERPTSPDVYKPTGPEGTSGNGFYKPGVPAGRFEGSFIGTYYNRPDQLDHSRRTHTNGHTTDTDFGGQYPTTDNRVNERPEYAQPEKPGTQDRLRVPPTAPTNGDGYYSYPEGSRSPEQFRPETLEPHYDRPVGQFSGKFSGDYVPHNDHVGNFTGRFSGQYGSPQQIGKQTSQNGVTDHIRGSSLIPTAESEIPRRDQLDHLGRVDGRIHTDDQLTNDLSSQYQDPLKKPVYIDRRIYKPHLQPDGQSEIPRWDHLEQDLHNGAMTGNGAPRQPQQPKLYYTRPEEFYDRAQNGEFSGKVAGGYTPHLGGAGKFTGQITGHYSSAPSGQITGTGDTTGRYSSIPPGQITGGTLGYPSYDTSRGDQYDTRVPQTGTTGVRLPIAGSSGESGPVRDPVSGTESGRYYGKPGQEYYEPRRPSGISDSDGYQQPVYREPSGRKPDGYDGETDISGGRYDRIGNGGPPQIPSTGVSGGRYESPDQYKTPISGGRAEQGAEDYGRKPYDQYRIPSTGDRERIPSGGDDQFGESGGQFGTPDNGHFTRKPQDRYRTPSAGDYARQPTGGSTYDSEDYQKKPYDQHRAPDFRQPTGGGTYTSEDSQKRPYDQQRAPDVRQPTDGGTYASEDYQKRPYDQHRAPDFRQPGGGGTYTSEDYQKRPYDQQRAPDVRQPGGGGTYTSEGYQKRPYDQHRAPDAAHYDKHSVGTSVQNGDQYGRYENGDQHRLQPTGVSGEQHDRTGKYQFRTPDAAGTGDYAPPPDDQYRTHSRGDYDRAQGRGGTDIGSGITGSEDSDRSQYYDGRIEGERYADNGSDSQAQSSIQHVNNETEASASAQGTYAGGTAQSQVSGTYSGRGSFSASAGTIDGKRGAQTQVSGGKEGATSSAQGIGGVGKSQAQVQVASLTGDTTSSAQSGGDNHGTNTQVQAGGKGGMADAQANGLGSTSSQAQIGFTPYDKNEKDDQNSPFRGGGTASSQSGAYTGQSQAQIQGKFRYGIKYSGAAQAGSGTNATSSRNQTRPDGLSGVFSPFKHITYTSGTSDNVQSQHFSRETVTEKIPGELEENLQEEPTTTESSSLDYEDSEVLPNGDGDEYDYDIAESEESVTTAPAMRTLIRQTSRTQRQHIILDPLEDLDATVTQDQDSDFPSSKILQPGESIPGSPGYKIPQGFRGKLSSVAGQYTAARGYNSQAQSVTLTPGIGKITYKKPVYTVLSNTQLRNGGFGYGTSYTYQPVQYHLKSGQGYPKFVSVTKSETGSQNIQTGQKTPSIYYTQTSTCGYFTNTCVYSGGRKVCLPRPKTNPDGSPIKC